MSHIFMCMGRWDIVTSMQTWFVILPIPCIFMQTMSTKNYYNFGTINNDNSRHVTIDAPGADIASIVRSIFAEDVTFPSSSGAPDDSSENNSSSVSSECHSDISSSFIFTKKAKREGKIPSIIEAFKLVLSSRRDKSRALAQEVQHWQKEEYVDPHYNAQVMYNEIAKFMPLPFGYEAFKQHYNHTRK